MVAPELDEASRMPVHLFSCWPAALVIKGGQGERRVPRLASRYRPHEITCPGTFPCAVFALVHSSPAPPELQTIPAPFVQYAFPRSVEVVSRGWVFWPLETKCEAGLIQMFNSHSVAFNVRQELGSVVRR